MAYNPYVNDPYSNQTNVYGGASANGTQGSQTNSSVANAAMQTGRGGNPAQSFGSAAQQWSQYLSGQMQPDRQVRQAPNPRGGQRQVRQAIPKDSATSGGWSSITDGGNGNYLGSGPLMVGAAPPHGGGSGWSSITDGGNGNFLGSGPLLVGGAPNADMSAGHWSIGIGDNFPPSYFNKGNGQKYEGTTGSGFNEAALMQQGGNNPFNNQGGDPWSIGIGDSFPVDGPYQPQLPAPERTGNVPAPAPQTPTTGRGGRGVRTGAPLPNPVVNPPAPTQQTAGPMAWDDLASKYADDAKAQGHDYEWLRGNGWMVQQYQEDMQRMGLYNQPGAPDFVDWAKSRFPSFSHTLAGRQGYDTFINTADGGMRGWGGSGTATPGSYGAGGSWDSFVASQATPQAPASPTSTTTTTSSKSATTTPGGGNAPDMEAYMAALFGRQSDQLQRRLDAKAANMGTLQSGGYLASSADAQAALSAEQGGQLGGYLFQDVMSQRDNDLKRYLGQLDSETSKYGADAAAKAAKYGASASRSAARYGADASRYNADLDYRLGLDRLRYDDMFNQRNYDLGIFGINRDIYGMDEGNRLKYLQMLYGMSPDARMNGMPFGLPDPMGYF
jgi:hypothetical protein